MIMTRSQSFKGLGLCCGHIGLRENQMEKKMESDMETRKCIGVIFEVDKLGL